MAELASAIAGKILEKLVPLVIEELRLVSDIRSELTELQVTMTTIKAVLLDAEEKQATDHKLGDWLRKLKDIFYDAEDVLGEVEHEVLKKQVVTTNESTSRLVRGFFSCCGAFAFRSQLGHKIKHIREKLGKIEASKNQFGLTSRLEDRHVMHRRRDMTHSYVPPLDVIGRDNDKANIVSLLTEPGSDRNVHVIPIVGLGGLGKTTIAQWVYNDKQVANHFELRMWVCVSDDFDVPRLIREILKSATGTIDETLGVDLWQTSLRNCLKNKMFLLVLDDVWNENRGNWKELEGLLSGGSKGSKILVTTRSNKVASIVGTCPPYTLFGLSYSDCLSLFVRSAFKEEEDKQYPNLLEIGKEIVEKCKGVPLAIKTLGNLLFSEVDEREWKFVRDNDIWKLEQNEDDILPALKLSYDKMSSHLKQCFAFCSLFPKDYLFGNGELIAFWMAHGLLNKMPNLELEDVGDLYIKELWSRSFFQDVRNYNPYCYVFKMHDLVHDLALKVAEEECSTIVSCTQNIAETVRHLSFSHDGLQVPNCFYKLSNGVRTTLFPTVKNQLVLVEECILRFKYLRMLDLSNSSFEVLPNSIGTLKYLRYLSLANNAQIMELPNSISMLYNLQTLLLSGCIRLKSSPNDTRNMISLRYLEITTTNTCLFDNGICFSNSLRVLVITRSRRLEVLFQGMEVSFTNLRTVVVQNCNRLTCLTHDLKHLRALETLVIRFCDVLSLTGGEGNWDLKLSLRKLVIDYLPWLEVLPQWLKESTNTLQYLSISRCDKFMALPEWLPSLKSLQTLEINGCSNLSSLPEGMDRLTVLRELTIKNSTELIRKCEEEDWPKIAHIPKVRLLYD